jgi:hypothetical protein
MGQKVSCHLVAMSRTSTLKNQHDDIVAMAERALDLIDAYRGVDQQAYSISVQLAKLFGLLRIHLMQEDLQFYPWLTACGDPEAARLACVYFAEMGELAPKIEQFSRRWSSSSVITGSFEQFRIHARALIATIELRIERENGFLYPLADLLAERELSESPVPPPPRRPVPSVSRQPALRA